MMMIIIIKAAIQMPINSEWKNKMYIHKLEYMAAMRMNNLVTWVCSVYKM